METNMTRPAALIVDDDVEAPHGREAQQAWLARIARASLSGWDIYTASSRDEALNLSNQLRDLRVAVVDLYLTYPPTSREGLDLLKEIRRTHPDCFNILVSGKTQRSEG